MAKQQGSVAGGDDPASENARTSPSAHHQGYGMAERDQTDKARQIEELARMIYLEVQRQIDANWPANAAIIEAGSLRNVLIEGRVDLLKIATALSARYDIGAPDIETIADNSQLAGSKRGLLPNS
jgi:hypothetical protein